MPEGAGGTVLLEKNGNGDAGTDGGIPVETGTLARRLALCVRIYYNEKAMAPEERLYFRHQMTDETAEMR